MRNAVLAALAAPALAVASSASAGLLLIDHPELLETYVFVWDWGTDPPEDFELQGGLEVLILEKPDTRAIAGALPDRVWVHAETFGQGLHSHASATNELYFNVSEPTLVLIEWDLRESGDGEGIVSRVVLTGGSILLDTNDEPVTGSRAFLLLPSTENFYYNADMQLFNNGVGPAKLNFASMTVIPIPEPASMAVLGLGAGMLIRSRRRSSLPGVPCRT